MTSLRAALRSLLALGGTPRGIAGGFTLGLALSLIPIPFAGMIAALALAPLLRCNLPATYLGTAVVNPITGAFFYAAELWIGLALLGRTAPAWAELRALDATGWWSLLREMVLPFVLGAATLATVSTLLAWPAVHLLVTRWQRTRATNENADPS
ncbi:MAG: DUF2062 domain-containing protein [Deltaproteobacteria bacterium]|nr:DUF2062 domain-containing protein [Nannocystaceae bacterium]